ncbi:GNAT family N-acetyltransferase [Siccibacter colletis]|uniref:GNAT family N-acetyltransferase n=1 Tax=Siccibacter colletis TaxID=1505757 RepID=UPI003CE7AA52
MSQERVYCVAPVDPTEPDALALQAALSETLEGLTGSSGRASFSYDDVRVKGAGFFIARDEAGKPVGCVGCRPLQEGIGELKRLFALPGNPGAGVTLLRWVEQWAVRQGYRELWLETRTSNQKAVEFYLRAGYAIIDNYGRYVGQEDAVCFAIRLEDKHAERA